ncbi:MAG: MATE family efflux transporter [Armatimonadetes bacterium]|nr:MATE family efflux transporter [Armatimonadota bacterium]
MSEALVEYSELEPQPVRIEGGHGELGTLRSLLSLAVPLVLASTGQTLMHLLDGLFLSWYSPSAMAAHGPASMFCWLLMSMFIGAAGFSSTFVAQYHGAGRPERISLVVWQAIRFALGAGLLLAVIAWPLSGVFRWVGHEPRLASNEAAFFNIACLGAPLALLSSSLSGFFSGRGENRTLMAVQLSAQVVNAVLAWALIFGVGGHAGLGLRGAALATIGAQGWCALWLTLLFLSPRNRAVYGTWRNRAFDRELLGRLLRYGLPNGMRFTVEVIGWTAFLLIVGRLGESALTATNIVWRINSLAFFPLFGLSAAVATQVGQGQGRLRPDLSERVAWTGLKIAQGWMLLATLVFLLAPRSLLHMFMPHWATDPAAQATIATGVVLLRFVAAYCLTDAANLILMGALTGAGDTRATLVLSVGLYSGFLLTLGLLDHLGQGLYALWTAATVMVTVLACALFARFRSRRWHHMRVIEMGSVTV